MRKKINSLLDACPGDIVHFVYLSGSHPGDVRRVQIQEFSTNKNKSHVSMIGIDLDINQQRRFMINMSKDIWLEYDESKHCNNAVSLDYIISTNGTITLYTDQQIYSIAKDHMNYSKIVDLLNEDDYTYYINQILDLIQTTPVIINYTQNNVEIKNGQIYYKNEVLHNCLVTRLLDLYEHGYPFKPLLKFLENIMENPSSRAIDELYTFLEHKHLPITSDGYFLAYKKVRSDYKDFYSGKISNKIGDKPSMPRNQVGDDFNEGCSKGLHVGSLEYARDQFHPNEGHVIICKVNPKDVVSVPSDCDCQKVRVCDYEVYAKLDENNLSGGLEALLYK